MEKLAINISKENLQTKVREKFCLPGLTYFRFFKMKSYLVLFVSIQIILFSMCFLNSKHNHYKDGTANPFLICTTAEWPQMWPDVGLLSVGWQGLPLVEHLEVIPQQSQPVALLARKQEMKHLCDR